MGMGDVGLSILENIGIPRQRSLLVDSRVLSIAGEAVSALVDLGVDFP